MFRTMIFTVYLTINVSALKSQLANDTASPFWIDPCGTRNNEETVSSGDVIERVLVTAKRNQQCFDRFKKQFVKSLIGDEFAKHYKTWSHLKNTWMPDDLPTTPGQFLSKFWSRGRLSFPEELPFTYDILQRVSVGFEKLADDAHKSNSSYFKRLSACKNYLRELLCEVNDAIYDMEQEPLPDVQREVMPDDVRHEQDEGRNDLLNSIIFRDYIIGVEYVIWTYRFFKIYDFTLSRGLEFIGKKNSKLENTI
ncbi:uncharacterized protein LOC126837339 [Adelges cooleyi]|uniref:uncharacterized protein LOC126837339 n=1 Tax=Adelges cooleyi TaxID=133065 RepID=UPI0021804007|nr:uncharacterized protein LOC126837339 [Adelges cooleyi]